AVMRTGDDMNMRFVLIATMTFWCLLNLPARAAGELTCESSIEGLVASVRKVVQAEQNSPDDVETLNAALKLKKDTVAKICRMEGTLSVLDKLERETR